MSKELTKKQMAFCREYVVDYNGTQACIRAGYSERSARSTASDFLTKANIKERIKELEAEKAKRNNIDVDKVLSEYAKIAFTDLPGIVDFKKGVMSVQDFDKLTPDQRSCIKKFKVKTTQTIQDKESVPVEYVEIELHDKQHALDMIGKHLGMFIEKHDLNLNNAPDIIVNLVKDPQKKK